MIGYCPHCNARYATSEHSGDFVHKCSSQILTLDQEDVPMVGNITNPDGVAVTRAPAMVNFAGVENKLQGGRAGIEGERLQDVTVRGNRASTHQTRQHFQHIEPKKPVASLNP